MPRLSREELLQVVGEINVVVQQIDAAYEAGEPNRDIRCPRCGGHLLYTKAVDYNGHRHANCTNHECTFGFIE